MPFGDELQDLRLAAGQARCVVDGHGNRAHRADTRSGEVDRVLERLADRRSEVLWIRRLDHVRRRTRVERRVDVLPVLVGREDDDLDLGELRAGPV